MIDADRGAAEVGADDRIADVGAAYRVATIDANRAGVEVGAGVSPDDASLLAALRRGDERAFAALVHQHHSAMVRTALLYVRERPVAEEVVQEAWIGILRGLDRFEGRSALKTWMFRIVANVAKTRSQREGRTIPFSAFGSFDDDDDASAVEPERFLPPNHPQWPGHWQAPPQSWDGMEDRLAAIETRRLVEAAIETLPPNQRQVITLRDVEGWSAGEVCNTLEISETNQRVLLHRARSKVRRALEAALR